MINPVSLLALALALGGLIMLVALIWHRRWLELALVVLVGCALALHLERGRRGPHAVGTTVARVLNADGSYSLHVRIPDAGGPLFYREWHGFIMGESAEGRRKKGTGIVGETSRPPENRWEILVSDDESFVPDECGPGLKVLSKPKPLKFDENGNCRYPPEPGHSPRTVTRKPDGTVVFTIGPEAFDLPAERFDPPLPRNLSVSFNGVSKGAITKPACEEPSDASPAESAEPGGGSGEAQPPPVESHAESAENAE